MKWTVYSCPEHGAVSAVDYHRKTDTHKCGVKWRKGMNGYCGQTLTAHVVTADDNQSYPGLNTEELLTLEAGLYNRRDTAFHATIEGQRIQRKLNKEWERILGPDWRTIKRRP